jgi:hypothetical protein
MRFLVFQADSNWRPVIVARFNNVFDAIQFGMKYCPSPTDFWPWAIRDAHVGEWIRREEIPPMCWNDGEGCS